MARARQALEPLLKQLIANHPDWGPEPLEARLKKEAKKAGLSDEQIKDLPKPRTIGRLKAEFLEEQRGPYKLISWPETFEANLLPWPAAPYAMTVVRRFNAMSKMLFIPEERPTVRHVLWAWRISRALSTERYDKGIWAAARYMTLAESAPPDAARIIRTAVENWLLQDHDVLPSFLEMGIDTLNATWLDMEYRTADAFWVGEPDEPDWVVELKNRVSNDS